jgi:uncharacterized RDD family membrane protein YckC
VEDAIHAYGGSEIALEAEEPPAAPDVELVPAERWRRLLAAGLDAFVLVALLCAVALAKTAHLDEGEKPDDVGSSALIVVIAWVLYLWLGNIIGVSLGKLQIGLRVVRSGTDEAPGPLLGTLRVAVALCGYAAALLALLFTPLPVFYVGTAVLAINLAWSFVDRDRRALHDIVAGTRVMRTAHRLEDNEAQAAAD